MDSRTIIKFRCWSLDGGEAHHWDSLTSSPFGGNGVSLAQEGTGVRDSRNQEIFRGDVLVWGGVHFLVGFDKGSYHLIQLDGEGAEQSPNRWFPDCSLEEAEVTGNSHDNSELVVHCLNRLWKLGKHSGEKP